jgi:hypothetical protein
MSSIFLSHSSNDNFEAVALRDWLAREGWDDVFLDLDPDRGIAAGERWERALHEQANRCEAVILLVSANWLGSGWCLHEYTLARTLNKKLFAVVTDPTKSIADLPPELKGAWQAVELTGGQDGVLLPTQLPGSHEEKHVLFSRDGLRRLKRGLDKAGLDPKFFAWPPESDRERAPYRGLKSLEAADAGIFFGRDAPIVEAMDRLRGLKAAAPPRLLVILGASGAGKSSFLRAGLWPRLARDDRNFLPLPLIRPERAALSGENGLLAGLAAALPQSRAVLRKAIETGASALRPLLAELAGRIPASEGEKPPVIVRPGRSPRRAQILPGQPRHRRPSRQGRSRQRRVAARSVRLLRKSRKRGSAICPSPTEKSETSRSPRATCPPRSNPTRTASPSQTVSPRPIPATQGGSAICPSPTKKSETSRSRRAISPPPSNPTRTASPSQTVSPRPIPETQGGSAICPSPTTRSATSRSPRAISPSKPTTTASPSEIASPRPIPETQGGSAIYPSPTKRSATSRSTRATSPPTSKPTRTASPSPTASPRPIPETQGGSAMSRYRMPSSQMFI